MDSLLISSVKELKLSSNVLIKAAQVIFA